MRQAPAFVLGERGRETRKVVRRGTVDRYQFGHVTVDELRQSRVSGGREAFPVESAVRKAQNRDRQPGLVSRNEARHPRAAEQGQRLLVPLARRAAHEVVRGADAGFPLLRVVEPLPRVTRRDVDRADGRSGRDRGGELGIGEDDVVVGVRPDRHRRVPAGRFARGRCTHRRRRRGDRPEWYPRAHRRTAPTELTQQQNTAGAESRQRQTADDQAASGHANTAWITRRILSPAFRPGKLLVLHRSSVPCPPAARSDGLGSSARSVTSRRYRAEPGEAGTPHQTPPSGGEERADRRAHPAASEPPGGGDYPAQPPRASPAARGARRVGFRHG